MRIEHVDHRRAGVAAAIHSVHMLAYAQEATLLQLDRFEPLETTVDEIARSEQRYIAAFDGHRLVGVTSVEPGEIERMKWRTELELAPWGLQTGDDRRHVHIASLVVAPDRQREGVGRALVGAVIADHRFEIVTVSTAVGNSPAIRLYAAMGFFEWGRRALTGGLEIVLLGRNAS
jgi:ribosomal protein S18 acetylase RimI-like enzyme